MIILPKDVSKWIWEHHIFQNFLKEHELRPNVQVAVKSILYR